LECDDGAIDASGYEGGDEATSTPDIDVSYLPLPSDSDDWFEAAPETSANVFVGTQESETLLNDDSQLDVVDSNIISGDEESVTIAKLEPVTANMENATALAVQSHALESQENQDESTLDPNTIPAARLVGIYLSKT
jgi:hypothetical protein